MKILLINPPDLTPLGSEVPEIVNEERGHNPPLGLLYVAAYLIENSKGSKHKVKVLDASVEGLGFEDIKERIANLRPDIIGMTAMSFTLLDCLKIADIAKKIDKDVKVVLGGPHVNLYPEESLSIENIDFLVLGEGERPFLELVENIENPAKVDGIGFKQDGKIHLNQKLPLIEDLDEIPFPARHLTPYRKYNSLLGKHDIVTTMITSRGCPYKCLFCDRPHLGKVFRARSAENVFQELKECVDMGINEFLIYDDTFTIDRKRVVDICNLIIKGGLDISWDIRARVNTVDYKLLKLLKKAGCERIHYGVEAGNPEILKVLRKGITKEQVREVFKMTKKAGIQILAYFMIGSPRETEETIQETIDFAKELEPDYVHFTITTPFPGTELYFMGLKEGLIKKDVWREFARNPTSDFVPPLWEENLTREELIRLLKKAYKEFYTRPSYILKRLVKVRSLGEFKRKAKAGLKVFGL
ncbi:TPA: radical SAM protein [Candidatus Woesearchaeota archaeon]|nr:radical SAM protein [Candidatus Woesearchaeota archaeon]